MGVFVGGAGVRVVDEEKGKMTTQKLQMAKKTDVVNSLEQVNNSNCTRVFSSL
ncbi:hypothetical protein [Aliikangiella sp. IMCC44359]|uniref:hypothetical protein n=1 Tax=Aliikangiella sp. IMCC44359 TaxID=3459125 RepID=UPI00403AE9FF